jgi:cytochrome c-type biogenesis protein CcmH/NrfG
VKKIAYAALLIIAIAGIYLHIGALSGLRAYEALYAFNQHPEREGYDHLQSTLTTHIRKTEDPLSHLLQARLYFADKNYQAAVYGFEKAYAALDKDAGVLVEYATALYFLNAADPRLPSLIATLRKVDPVPLAAHSLLANIAIDNHDPATAKQHWKALLNELPADSAQRPYVETLIRGPTT